MAELVAGHSQDNEPLAGIALVELVHLGVIPGGRTSERRDVLNEDDFAPQGGEIKGFTRQQVGREVVEFRGHSDADAVVCTRCFTPNFLRSVSLAFLGETSRDVGVFICQDSSHPAPCHVGWVTSTSPEKPTLA